MLTISELKKIGTLCQIDGEPYQVIWTQHVQMGRGGAILRLKVRNLVSGNVLEKTVKGSDSLEEAEVSRNKANFLYSDQEGCHFMDNENYEQISLSKDQLEGKDGYLTEGTEVSILKFNDQPIGVQLPTKVNLKVDSAPEGVKGDTAQGKVTKRATLETGIEINVPLFVKSGDVIKINTDTGEYVERV